MIIEIAQYKLLGRDDDHTLALEAIRDALLRNPSVQDLITTHPDCDLPAIAFEWACELARQSEDATESLAVLIRVFHKEHKHVGS